MGFAASGPTGGAEPKRRLGVRMDGLRRVRTDGRAEPKRRLGIRMDGFAAYGPMGESNDTTAGGLGWLRAALRRRGPSGRPRREPGRDPSPCAKNSKARRWRAFWFLAGGLGFEPR